MAKRSIFEEVESDARPEITAGVIERAAQSGDRRAVRIWLAILFGLVVIMIAVGGLTRLTDSGLSITEWKPLTGALPPLSQADWDAEFALYKEIPEYQLQNKGMSLEEFKVIYWWEWGHRQLGRVIGLVWALGLGGLLLARKVPQGWTPRLVLLGVLGGLQGAIGWWMVSSGLTGTMLDVASYRLAAHLGLAFVILGLIAWFLLSLSRPEAELIAARRNRDAGLARVTTVLLAVTGLQILLGALVAGIDAGRSYTDWPLMSGQILPPDPFYIEPLWRNFFENAGLVQFIHRAIGYVLVAVVLYAWMRGRASGNIATRFAFNLIIAMVAVQTLLGIVTVLYSAPWHLALAHQFGAVVLLSLILRARHRSLYPLAQTVRSSNGS